MRQHTHAVFLQRTDIIIPWIVDVAQVYCPEVNGETPENEQWEYCQNSCSDWTRCFTSCLLNENGEECGMMPDTCKRCSVFQTCPELLEDR
eukprot:UN04939